jgi:hypothetical protein
VARKLGGVVVSVARAAICVAACAAIAVTGIVVLRVLQVDVQGVDSNAARAIAAVAAVAALATAHAAGLRDAGYGQDGTGGKQLNVLTVNFGKAQCLGHFLSSSVGLREASSDGMADSANNYPDKPKFI